MKRQAEGRVKTSPLQRGESQKKRDITTVNSTTKPEKKQTAWDYYKQKGFSVFPVDENKRPVAALLPKDEKGKPTWKPFQTRFANEVEFDRFKKSKYNIAIATGALSDLMVVDEDSTEARRELERLNPDAIKMPTVNTPRGGRHYYGRHNPSSWKNLQGFGKSKKIDLKTEGGYVLAPPSVTKDGRYEWATEQDLDTILLKTVFPKRWEYLLLHARLSRQIGRAEEPGPRLEEGGRDVDIFRMACLMRREGYERKEVEEMAVMMAEKARLKPHTTPFTNEDALDKVKSAWSYAPPSVTGREIDPSIPMSICLSEVPEEPEVWLWKNYIPSEAITLVSGDPDAGKSWWAMDIACRVSRGSDWPDGEEGGDPKRVYFMTYESSLTKTVKKRIRWMGGDESLITCYNSKHPLHLTLSTPEGRERLEEELVRLGINGLVTIDPILDFTGSNNPNAVEEVRGLLTPIITMLERLHLPCIMIGHLNKDQMKQAMYRAGGSTGGWIGKARAAFLIGRDQEERTKRYVFPIKNNNAWPEPVKMEFEIIDNKLEFQVTDVDINEVLNPQRGRPPVSREEAIEWIAGVFGDRNEVPSAEIERRRRTEKPCSKTTLESVKDAAGYFSDRSGPGGSWVWKKRGENDAQQGR